MERNAAGDLEITSPVNTEGGEWEAYFITELGIWNRTQGGHVYSSNAGLYGSAYTKLDPLPKS